MEIKTRADRNRILNTLPNDLRAVINTLDAALDDAAHEYKGGAITDEQYTDFWRLFRFTVRTRRDDTRFTDV